MVVCTPADVLCNLSNAYFSSVSGCIEIWKSFELQEAFCEFKDANVRFDEVVLHFF
jgi:hypothetical protein